MLIPSPCRKYISLQWTKKRGRLQFNCNLEQITKITNLHSFPFLYFEENRHRLLSFLHPVPSPFVSCAAHPPTVFNGFCVYNNNASKLYSAKCVCSFPKKKSEDGCHHTATNKVPPTSRPPWQNGTFCTNKNEMKRTRTQKHTYEKKKKTKREVKVFPVFPKWFAI